MAIGIVLVVLGSLFVFFMGAAQAVAWVDLIGTGMALVGVLLITASLAVLAWRHLP